MKQRPQNESGSVLVIAMVSIVGLMTLGSLSVLAVQSSFAATSHHRFRAVALYAAESGLSAGKVALVNNYSASEFWSNHVAAPNGVAPVPLQIYGNEIKEGEVGNVFNSPNTWYSVTVENNKNDPGYELGLDQDRRVILRSEGHGPNGTTVIVEAEVGPGQPIGKEVPCPAYAQQNINASGSGLSLIHI